MGQKLNKLLLAFLFVAGCYTDYGIMKPGEKEYVYITETETVTETVTETETVEVEVEVPVYIEVEVPVYIEDTAVDDPGLIWVDSFIQPNTVDGIDILWVIDTSGSMHRYDAQLMAGIDVMLAALPPTSWRLVMMSNDPSRAVLESQFPLVPGDDILDAEAMYASMGRGGHEEGFDAVYEYMFSNPYSSTWMRPDAGLLVVFVSDEEEQSNDHFVDVHEFISWYRAQRGGSVFLASIVNHEASISLCDYPPSPIDVGHRYMEATAAFAGNIIDICADDWSPGVADAAASVEPHEQWPLTHSPVEDSIRVFINGALDHSWTYSSTDNTVLFTTIPAGSALVEIGYRYYPASEPLDTGT